MKCEICHKADASEAISRGDGGEDDELYVCAACAKAEKERRQRKSQRTRKVTGLPPGVSMSITEISRQADDQADDDTPEPPPFKRYTSSISQSSLSIIIVSLIGM